MKLSSFWRTVIFTFLAVEQRLDRSTVLGFSTPNREKSLNNNNNNNKPSFTKTPYFSQTNSSILKMTVTTTFLRSFWSLATRIGMRRLGTLLKRWYPSAYGDTIFYFDADGVDGYVALTIDDGLCRGEDPSKNSMVQNVHELLHSYQAHATFFVCTEYTAAAAARDQALVLLQDGHELGNHLAEDRSGYYCHLSKADFQNELLQANQRIQDISIGSTSTSTATSSSAYPAPPRWFRAPQGRMTSVMCQVLQEQGMTHVLGDCYCDDWAFAEHDGGGGEYTRGVVAPLMLSQVQPSGSIAIFHMPERGFREASLGALQEFLEGCRQRNLQCISLTEMMQKRNEQT
jgi:peptidoglycan/xylan/chitin deacetylase (PgdA/CDA1 family)